jgi:hypothetical protein
MKGFVKDPDSVLDYTFDWTDWLDGDTINSSTWTIESPLTMVPASDSYSDTKTTLYLTGGDAGSDYLVTNRITTAASRTAERSFEIRIRER